MQKIITYIFILFYFLLSIGITADVHFCNGKIHSISITKVPVKSCCGIKEKDCGCCDDINIVFQKTDDEKINSIDKIQITSIVIVSDISPVFKTSKSFVPRTVKNPKYYFPPPNSSYPSINIRNCTFLI